MGIINKIFGKRENKQSAKKAKERLLITLQYERALTKRFPYIEELRKDILKVIEKYNDVKDVSIRTSNEDNLEIEVIFNEEKENK